MVSVADQDTVWKVWQRPLDESKHSLYGFGDKVLTSTVDNDSPFKKQLLVCYWAFVET